MGSSPYEVTSSEDNHGRAVGTRWMIVVGCVSLLLAAVCLIAVIVGTMLSFRAIANSPTAPSPSDLAGSIGMAAIPAYAVGPLAIVGVVLLVLGYVTRKPASKK